MAKSELHRDYILELESELQEFEKKADSTTKRMQMLVYPAMVAFFILAAFGFYLIFSLTSDVNRMANTFVHMSGSIEKNMDSISGTMGHMSGQMDDLVVSTSSMSNSVGDMSSNVGNMTDNTVEMVNSISGLRAATYDMAASTNHMQRDMWSLNKNISTPLSAMNKFIPWKDSKSMPFQGSPMPLPKSYFAYPTQLPPDYGRAGNPIQAPMPLPIPVPDTYSAPPIIPTSPTGVTMESNDQSSLVTPFPILPVNTVTLN